MDLYADALSKLTDLIRSEMGENPEPGEHVIRCKPGSVPLRLPASVRRSESRVVLDGSVVERSKVPEGRAADDAVFIVEGVASSTSVDWYGTEMSPRALDDMANQFNRGVDLFPRHGGFLDTVEWDEVVGRTFAAGLQEADVADPADVSERGFVLGIQARVNRNAPRAEELERRLDDGQEIGLSIGGWFLEVRYVTDDDGEIERIIVERVLLDHVAIVRSPANPDSYGLQILRDAGRAAKAIRSTDLGDVQTRHVIRVEEEDDAIVIRLAKGAASPSEDEPEEEDDRTSGTPEPRSEGNPEEVPSISGDDNSYHPGDEFTAGGDHSPGGDPEHRSDAMSGDNTEMMDLLRSIKAGQDKLTERVETLEGRASATPEETPEATPEATVEATPAEDIADLIARTVAATVEATRAAAPETPTPAPAEGSEVEELRARIAGLEAERDNRDEALANLVGSGRVGRGSRMTTPVLGGGFDSEQAGRDIDLLIERCKANGDTAPVLCAVVNRHKKAIAITREASGHLPRGERGREYLQAAHNADATLRQILIGAERDGLIGDLDRGWVR